MRNKPGWSALLVWATVISISACANPSAQISVPIGPFGRVGVSVGSGGQVNGHVGVGTSVGGVSVGAGADLPISEGR